MYDQEAEEVSVTNFWLLAGADYLQWQLFLRT